MPKISENKKITMIDIGQNILSIALSDPDTISRIVTKLNGFDFISDEDTIIFNVIKKSFNEGVDINPLTIITLIQSNSDYDFENIHEYIGNLISMYVHSDDLESYITLMLDHSIAKKLNQFGTKIVDMDIDFENFDDSMWSLEKEFMELIKSKNSTDFLTSKEIADSYKQKLTNIRLNKGTLTGTGTGFESIDKFTNGFQPGDLIILAARPSIGKTALSLNMLLNVARTCEDDECVVMFSLEMGADQLYQRLVSCESSVLSSALRDGTWSENDEYLIYEAIKKIGQMPIYIDDCSNISIMEIQTKLKQIVSNKKKIKLVIIDYLQLVQGSSKIGTNRQQEVSQISRVLKSIARDINAPVIAVAQLSRKIEERKGADKKPMLSDLRESGAIEQDADLVTFLNYDRDEIDNQKSNDSTKTYMQNVLVDFIIAKHRNGATGQVQLVFEKQIGKYSDFK